MITFKSKYSNKTRTLAQVMQATLFQESGTLARLRINAVIFAKTLSGIELLICEQFVDIVSEAIENNKVKLQNLPSKKNLNIKKAQEIK